LEFVGVGAVEEGTNGRERTEPPSTEVRSSFIDIYIFVNMKALLRNFHPLIN
jgi:hypothetical protein